MKKILILLAAVAIAASCEPSTGSTAEITFSLEMNGAAYVSPDRQISVTDLNTSTTFTVTTGTDGKARIQLLPGVYEASVSFQIEENGETALVNAIRSDITAVAGQKQTYTLNLIGSKKSSIVIKEFYNSGCQKDDGSGSTMNDGYVILYNNSDKAVDASNYCFAFCGINSFGGEMDDYTVNGKLVFEDEGFIPAFQGIWRFNTNVTIEPYSQIVVALFSAIDHTQTYSNSVNLSNSSYYVMYNPESGWNMENKYITPSANIPTDHYLKASIFGIQAIAWSISASGPAFFIFEKENAHDYVMNPDNIDERNMWKGARIPFAWIVDGVEIFGTEYPEDNRKRFTAHVDAGKVMHTSQMGYTLYRNVDKEATEALDSNAGKLVYGYAGGTSDAGVTYGSTDPSGIDAEKSIANGAKIIYKDTNNSTNDFHERKYASLTGK